MAHSRGNQYEYGRFKLVLPRSFRKAFLIHGSIGFQPVFPPRALQARMLMLHCRRPMVAQASSLYSGRALQAGYATLPATNGSIGFQPVFRARPTSRICYTAGVPMVAQASSLYSGRALQAGYATLPGSPARTEPRPTGHHGKTNHYERTTSRSRIPGNLPGTVGQKPFAG